MQEAQLHNLRRITYTLFQQASDQRKKQSQIVVLTSSTPREGVTFVSKLIAEDLAFDPQGSTLYCTPQSLATTILIEGNEHGYMLTASGYWVLRGAETDRLSWDYSFRDRFAKLQILRGRFQYVIIDCGSVTEPDVDAIVSMVDAVLLVVAAGKSSRNQIRNAKQVITQAGGVLRGCILNRTKNPIPGIINRLLEGSTR